MGVYLSMRSATPEQIVALHAQPDLIPAFFEALAFQDVLPKPTFWQLLTGRGPQPPEVLLDRSNCLETDLGQSWHALHFLFTGTADGGQPPASYLLKGGLDLNFGGTDAHALSPRQLQEFRSFVDGLPDEELRSRFNPGKMTELHIYPEIIWKRDPEASLADVLEHHQRLSEFLRDAAGESQGCVIWIG